jgi:hypothetical protein
VQLRGEGFAVQLERCIRHTRTVIASALKIAKIGFLNAGYVHGA